MSYKALWSASKSVQRWGSLTAWFLKLREKQDTFR